MKYVVDTTEEIRQVTLNTRFNGVDVLIDGITVMRIDNDGHIVRPALQNREIERLGVRVNSRKEIATYSEDRKL